MEAPLPKSVWEIFCPVVFAEVLVIACEWFALVLVDVLVLLELVVYPVAEHSCVGHARAQVLT